MSPNTERRYRAVLERAGLLTGPPDDVPELARLRAVLDTELLASRPPQQSSSVTTWALEVSTILEGGAAPTAIYDRLRLKHKDSKGSLSAIKRLCLRLKKALPLGATGP